MDADKTTKPDLSQLKITRREPPVRRASWLKPWMGLILLLPLVLWGGRWWLSSSELPAVNVQVARTAGAAAVSSVLDARG